MTTNNRFHYDDDYYDDYYDYYEYCDELLKTFCQIIKMKNIQPKIKPIKLKKKSGTTHCLGCKDYNHNFRPKQVNMTNKIFREKSNCMVCWSNKSRFLKQNSFYKL